jgi:hypothetical protein
LRYWNWSLSSAFSPEALAGAGDEVDDAAGFARDLRTMDAGRARSYGR